MTASFGTPAHPIILGIVGDSAAGKTTLSQGIAKILGEDHVAVLCTDDYHRYNRQQRKERNITPLNPECNYLLERGIRDHLDTHGAASDEHIGLYSADSNPQRSHPLALTQLLLVYHLLRARQRDEVEI